MDLSVRSLLERFSRNRTIKRHLPKEFLGVPIIVSPDASLGFWKPGPIKSDLFNFAMEFVSEGSKVWDIGANVGLFSIAAAQKAGSTGRVIAIEADIWLADLLCKSSNIQLASSAHILVIPVAVAESIGIASFNIARRGRATNYLDLSGGSTQAGGVRETVSAITITLDWLLEQGVPPPEVLKIDVEGAESQVLRGAERVLAGPKPIILCEVFDGSSQAVTEILHRHGYTLFDWDSEPRVQTSQAVWNTLAIPNNR